MIPRSPLGAMLWENWRLSRVEAVQRLGLGLIAAAAALLFSPDRGATTAFWILAGAHGIFWFSIAKLNGGRFMDGYKPGFPFYLLYTRPVSTVAAVCVAMIYDAVSCALLYLLSAVTLQALFGKPFPLLPMAACIVTYHLASTCIQWSTRNRIVQWVGSIAIFAPLFVLIRSALRSLHEAPFPFAEYAVLASISVVAIAVTVVGVARQRRGDAVATEPTKDGWSGYPVWLVSLFKLPCPTSSATKAQLWFELKSTGLPVLTLGVALALLVLALTAVGIYIAPVRDAAVGIGVMSVPFVAILFGSNAFGIRSKQGRIYVSVFEATQPFDVARMAGLKVLVRAGCLLAALAAIVASVWASIALTSAWGSWLLDSGVNGVPGLQGVRTKIAAAMGAQTASVHVAQFVVMAIAVAGLVASQSSREALKARYPRQVLIVNWLPGIWGLTIVLAALAGQQQVLREEVVRGLIMASTWIASGALLLAAIYLLWRNIAERTLTPGYVAGAVLLLVVFAVAYVVLLKSAGLPRPRTPWTAIGVLVWPVVLLAIGGALAPWSLHRARHV